MCPLPYLRWIFICCVKVDWKLKVLPHSLHWYGLSLYPQNQYYLYTVSTPVRTLSPYPKTRYYQYIVYTGTASAPTKPILSIHCVPVPTNPIFSIHCAYTGTVSPSIRKTNIINSLCLQRTGTVSPCTPPKNQLYQQSILVSSHKHKTYKPICCSVSETLAMCTVFCLPFHVTVRWFHADNQWHSKG